MNQKNLVRSKTFPFICLTIPIVLLAAYSLQAASGDYAGDDVCSQCHEDVGEAFLATVHGRADLSGWDGAAGCEACHGPGMEHAEAGGDPALIRVLTTMEAADSSEICLGCHAGSSAAHWAGGAHDAADVSCADCHTVHAPWTNHQALANRNTTGMCLDCHADMRKHLHQRSGHPLRDGLMSCTSCHNPHGSLAEGEIAALTANDKCYECHADKRGPFLFEHAPVKEDCKTCHDPHGSNQTMMLTTSPPRLCQSCHLFGHHQTVPGTSGQVWNVNRSCVNCHPRIHGSNHPSGVIFMR